MRAGIFGILLAVIAGFASADVVVVGSYTWLENQPGFGGFSGLEVSQDGRSFTAISDRGQIVSGRFERKNGVITKVVADPLAPLHRADGRVIKDQENDSEGLAISASGQVYVSYEGLDRVWQHDLSGRFLASLPNHADFATFQDNSALEALAVDQAGTLYTLPERSGKLERPFPLYRYSGGAWRKGLSIPRRGRFLPVGIDFGPDGRLYLLERDFIWYGGFSSRIRRFDLAQNGLVDEVTLLESRYGDFENLEGIAVWQDTNQDIRITLISDDNFNLLLSTKFVELRLPAEVAD